MNLTQLSEDARFAGAWLESTAAAASFDGAAELVAAPIALRADLGTCECVLERWRGQSIGAQTWREYAESCMAHFSHSHEKCFRAELERLL